VRILLIRPDHLGDVLLTLPAVAALRRAVPGAHLTYALSPAVAAVAQHCPDLDATLSLAFPALDSGEPETAAWCERALAELAPSFDVALVLRPDDPWSGAFVAGAGIPLRLGFAMPRTRPYLTDALPVPGARHVVTHGFDLADAALGRLGVAARVERLVEPCLATGPAEEEEATRVLDEVGADRRPIVVHPGSGWPLKNWPTRRWRRLTAEIARRFRTRPIVAGGAGERLLVDEVVADGTPGIGLAGRLSLGALAAVHRRARVVVGTDSGALHLAAAMGAPVVGLFGPAHPVMFAPLCRPGRGRIVRVALPCSPCGTLERPPCGAAIEPDCIAAIGVEAVLRAVDELLGAGSCGVDHEPSGSRLTA
jgi:ADP-heptose:LPS heptosyltransferase